MYGFIKYGNEKETLIIGNNGKKYRLRKKNNFFRWGSRVEFEIDLNSRAYAIKVLKDNNLDGMIVRIDAEKAGLALMETGEVLEFDEKSFNNFSYSVYVGMKISGTAVNAVKGSSFGRLNNISYRKYQNIYKINYKRIQDILLERFKTEEIFPVREVIKFLKQECIIPNKYSYQNSVLFLESMADILRIDYSGKTVHIIGRTADEYADAVEIAEKYMGFEEFTIFQEIALRDSGFWNKRNILLMGVTSSGKTVLPILKYLVDRKNSGKRKKMLIAVPYRALAFQMYNKLNELLKNFSLDIALSTSEIVEHDMKITNGDVDIAIVIYEKIFMRVSTIENILERYDYITLDEFGIVQSKERGIKAEMILLAGNSAKRPKITIIGTPYFKWDSYIKNYNLYPIKAYSRPVPVQQFFYISEKIQHTNYKTGQKFEKNLYNLMTSDGEHIYTGQEKSFLETLADICISEWRQNKKAIVFKFSQKNVQHEAMDIYIRLKNKLKWADITESERLAFKNKLLRTYSLTDEELDIVFDRPEYLDAFRYGITFHHSSLPEFLRMAIEQEFFDAPKVVDGGIKLVFATETLAFGLNGNVDTVIITGISKTEFNIKRNLTINEYRNCIGRAGRLGYLTYGNSYTFIKEDEPDKVVSDYCKIFSQETVSGLLGTVLENRMLKENAFCLMGLFHERKSLTARNITDILMNVPVSSEIAYKDLCSDIEESLSFLSDEKLLSCRNEQDDYNDIFETHSNEKQYVLTVHGEKVQGYCTTIDSYRTAKIAGIQLIQGNKRCLVDYFFSITACTEAIGVCGDMLVIPENDRNSPDDIYWHDIDALVRYCDEQISELYSIDFISEELSESIRKSTVLECVRNGNLPSEEDLLYLARLKTAFIAVMWVLGYSQGLMCDIYGFDKGKMNNIKRKIGEKLSYITDMVLAITSTENISAEITHYIRQLSLCLMHGINIEWLIGSDIDELLPDEAQSYHTASIYYRRRCFVEKCGSEKQKALCADNYENLESMAKKILKMKGCELYGIQ